MRFYFDTERLQLEAQRAGLYFLVGKDYLFASASLESAQSHSLRCWVKPQLICSSHGRLRLSLTTFSERRRSRNGCLACSVPRSVTINWQFFISPFSAY